MSRPVNGPAAQIPDRRFGLLALPAEPSRGHGIKLRKDLDAQSSASVLKKTRQQFDGFLVLGTGGAVVSVHQNIGVDELSAHATRRASKWRSRECPSRAHSGFSPENGAWPSLYPDPAA